MAHNSMNRWFVIIKWSQCSTRPLCCRKFLRARTVATGVVGASRCTPCTLLGAVTSHRQYMRACPNIIFTHDVEFSSAVQHRQGAVVLLCAPAQTSKGRGDRAGTWTSSTSVERGAGAGVHDEQLGHDASTGLTRAVVDFGDLDDADQCVTILLHAPSCTQSFRIGVFTATLGSTVCNCCTRFLLLLLLLTLLLLVPDMHAGLQLC